MGENSTATAREVEETRKQMEDKVAKLSERAPEEARKLVDKLWDRATGELAPTKVMREDEADRD